MVLDALGTFEEQAFEKDHADKNWFKGKQRHRQLDILDERRGKGAFSEFLLLCPRALFGFVS